MAQQERLTVVELDDRIFDLANKAIAVAQVADQLTCDQRLRVGRLIANLSESIAFAHIRPRPLR